MVKLTPVQQRFILHWGEMGSRWGINRTAAQIHALLFVSPKPLNAEDISTCLDIARSNVSTSLRDLQGWGIVKLVHVMGDKRDHFDCLKEVWEVFRTVLDERKRREIDPTMACLQECIAEAEKVKGSDEYTRKQVESLLEFLELASCWYSQMRRWPAGTLVRFMRMGDRTLKALGLGPGQG